MAQDKEVTQEPDILERIDALTSRLYNETLDNDLRKQCSKAEVAETEDVAEMLELLIEAKKRFERYSVPKGTRDEIAYHRAKIWEALDMLEVTCQDMKEKLEAGERPGIYHFVKLDDRKEAVDKALNALDRVEPSGFLGMGEFDNIPIDGWSSSQLKRRVEGDQHDP